MWPGISDMPRKTLAMSRAISMKALVSLFLIGRPGIIDSRIQRFGLRLKSGKDFTIVNPEQVTNATVNTGRNTVISCRAKA